MPYPPTPLESDGPLPPSAPHAPFCGRAPLPPLPAPIGPASTPTPALPTPTAQYWTASGELESVIAGQPPAPVVKA